MATATIKVPPAQGSGYLQVSITYTVTNTDTTYKITATKVKYSAVGTDWYLDGSKHVTYDGTTLHTPPQQVLSAGKSKSYTISKSVTTTKTHAAQTKKFIYTFLSSVFAAITVPAKTSYKVTLNTNGGSGGTASLTKWYGETLSLTSGFTAPKRTGYKFVGWGETSTATATASQYTGNAAKTYYAVWERQITGITLNVTTLRVEDGTSTAEADEGTWCYGTCTYSITGTAAADVTFNVSVTPTDPQIVQTTYTATKNIDDTLTGSFVFRASDCSMESSYTFMVTATANNTSATQTVTKAQGNVLSMAYFVMDVLGDNYPGQRPGHGISFGEPCKSEGFRVGMKPYFGKYPIEDTNDKYALIIGNGTGDANRSNAFAVGWDGGITTSRPLFKRVTATSTAQTINAGAGLTFTITVNVPDGYTLFGVIGQTSNHNLAGTIGTARVTGANTVSTALTNRTASTNWNDATVTVDTVCILSTVV